MLPPLTHRLRMALVLVFSMATLGGLLYATVFVALADGIGFDDATPRDVAEAHRAAALTALITIGAFGPPLWVSARGLARRPRARWVQRVVLVAGALAMFAGAVTTTRSIGGVLPLVLLASGVGALRLALAAPAAPATR